MSSVTDKLELEVISNNVSEEEWSNELERLRDEQDSEIVEERVHTDTGYETAQTSSSITEISIKDAECILALLKTTKDCNKKGKWNEVSALQLQKKLSTTVSLKVLLDIELRVILRYLQRTKGSQRI